MKERELLAELCEYVLSRVYGFEIDHPDLAYALTNCGRVLSRVGWILLWGNDKEREKLFRELEYAFKNSLWLRSSIEEWLDYRLRKLEDEMEMRIEEEVQGNKQSTEPVSQQEEEEDELPF